MCGHCCTLTSGKVNAGAWAVFLTILHGAVALDGHTAKCNYVLSGEDFAQTLCHVHPGEVEIPRSSCQKTHAKPTNGLLRGLWATMRGLF